MRTIKAPLLSVLALVIACSGSGEVTSTQGATASASTTQGSDGMSSTTAANTGTDAGTTADVSASATATTTAATTTTATDTSSGGCPFICNPDAPLPEDCDLLAQDCPAGSKCTVWANDGGSAWNASKCVPVAEDPKGPGEPCTAIESPVSGLDDCALGGMCWKVDPETLEGTCIALCQGDYDLCQSEPASCCPEGQLCQIGRVLPLCITPCQPLEASCGDGEVCIPTNDTFQCAPDLSGEMGAVGDPCEFVNTCDHGTFCGDASIFPGCDPMVVGCCVPFCDLKAPACPQGTECTAWFEEEAPMGYETLGACVLPG